MLFRANTNMQVDLICPCLTARVEVRGTTPIVELIEVAQFMVKIG